MTKPSRKQHRFQQSHSYSHLESRQLLAADFSVAPVADDVFTVQPTIDFQEVQWGDATIDFQEVQWGDETRLAKSGEWLIW